MRSSVLLPQPEGPRMVTKSFSATGRSVASSAWRAIEAARDAAHLQDGGRARHRRQRARGAAHSAVTGMQMLQSKTPLAGSNFESTG